MDQVLTTETLVIQLLLIAAVVAIAVRRLRVPYTVALVVAGLLTAYQQAVPGVLLTTAAIGAIVAVGLGVPLSTGLVFGALISATDPVAVVALFRRLNVPRRLAVIIEGESL